MPSNSSFQFETTPHDILARSLSSVLLLLLLTDTAIASTMKPVTTIFPRNLFLPP